MRTEDLQSSKVLSIDDAGAPGVLVVSSPDESLRQRFFPLKPALTVGRAEAGDAPDAARIAAADTRISREHATLRWRADDQGCEVTDDGSRNGTFVARGRVTTAFVPVGSIVRVGDTFLEVTVAPASGLRAHPLLRGQSAALARLLADVERVARGDVSVLVEGETGTGKELVAEAIHAASGRTGKLVAINCASIPGEIAESFFFGHRKGAFTGAVADSDGVFERASDGTLFLDEIGELRLDLQAKLLRVLETRQFTPVGGSATRTTTARFVSATNALLRASVAAHTFRADLFARLAGVEIAAPPLRRRRSDVPILMAHFIERAASGPGAPITFSANAMEALLLYDWPMNVRELRSVCDRLRLALPAGGQVKSADLSAVLPLAPDERPFTAPPPALASATAPDRDELAGLLRTHHGNVLKLAGHYGKDRKQIYRWLEHHALDPRDFR